MFVEYCYCNILYMCKGNSSGLWNKAEMWWPALPVKKKNCSVTVGNRVYLQVAAGIWTGGKLKNLNKILKKLNCAIWWVSLSFNVLNGKVTAIWSSVFIHTHTHSSVIHANDYTFDLGYVYINLGKFENASFHPGFGFPSTPRRHFCPVKNEPFEIALPSG